MMKTNKLTRNLVLGASLLTVACGGERHLAEREGTVTITNLYGNKNCNYTGTVSVQDLSPKFGRPNLEFVVDLQLADESCDETIAPYGISATIGAEGDTLETLFATNFKGGALDYGSGIHIGGCDAGSYRTFLNKNALLRTIPNYTPGLNKMCTSEQREMIEQISRHTISTATKQTQNPQ